MSVILKSKIEFVDELKNIFLDSIQYIIKIRDEFVEKHNTRICIKYDSKNNLLEFHIEDLYENLVYELLDSSLYKLGYTNYAIFSHKKIKLSDKDTINKMLFNKVLYNMLINILDTDGLQDAIVSYPIILKFDEIVKLINKYRFIQHTHLYYMNIICFSDKLNVYYFKIEDSKLVEFDSDDLESHIKLIESEIDILRNIMEVK